MANKLRLTGSLLSYEKMFCKDTKSPFCTLRRLKHVLWKGWVRLVTFFTAFSILVLNQYITIEPYSYLTLFQVADQLKGGPLAPVREGRGGGEHTRRTPPPYGPESSYLFATRFSLNSKFYECRETFLTRQNFSQGLWADFRVLVLNVCQNSRIIKQYQSQ